jgi:radical SAM superfamily enzyme YgiQ (UPF0313 family)
MARMSADREIINTSEHIQKVLEENIKTFVDPGIISVYDSNLDNPDNFDKARIRVLLAFMMKGLSKCKGSADGILISLIKQNLGDQVYVDIAFMPEKQNFSLYEKHKLPVWHGVASHRSVLDFDVVLISNSVLPEKMNLPWLLHHSAIPIWHTQRMKEDRIPFFFVGGNSADFVDVFLGSSEDGKETALIDGAFIGYGEGVIPKIIDTLLEPYTSKEERLRKFFRFENFVHPLAYQYEYKDRWRISKVNKVIDDAPDKVKYHREESFDSSPKDVRKIIYSSIEPADDGMDVIISWGCSSGGSCSFCHEGNISGGWREKSLERIRSDLISSRKFGMCNSIGWLSFNNNYYSRYLDLVKLGLEIYPRVLFMTMRADIIAARSDYFTLANKLGMRSISYGFEGISERMRHYLNKNISTEEFKVAIRRCIDHHFQSVKLYCIYTGRETEEDKKEFVSFIQEMRDYALSLRTAGIKFEVSFTHLIYCTNTPMAWEKRNTYLMFLREERAFEGMLRMFVDEMGMQVRFSSRAWTNFVSQLMIDLGRVFTPFLVDMSINHSLVVYKKDCDGAGVKVLIEKLDRAGIDLQDVFDEKPYDFIFPDDIIDWNKEYLVRVNRSIRQFQQINHCLSTPAQLKGECVACGYCDTAEKRLARVEREFDVSTTVDDVLSFNEMGQAQNKLLVKLWREPEYSYLNVASNFRYLWSRIMRELPDNYVLSTREIGRCSYFIGIKKGNIPDYSWGVFLVEVLLRNEYSSLDEVKAAYTRVAPEVKTLGMVDLKYVDVGYRGVKYEDWQMLVIKPSDAVDVISIRESARNFDRRIVYPKNVKFADFHLIVGSPVLMPEIPEIFLSYTTGELVVSLPNKLNPFVFLSSMTGIKFLDVYTKFSCQRIKYFREGLGVCAVAGCNNHTYFDVYEQNDSRFCELCTRKAIVKKLGRL